VFSKSFLICSFSTSFKYFKDLWTFGANRQLTKENVRLKRTPKSGFWNNLKIEHWILAKKGTFDVYFQWNNAYILADCSLLDQTALNFKTWTFTLPLKSLPNWKFLKSWYAILLVFAKPFDRCVTMVYTVSHKSIRCEVPYEQKHVF